MKRTPRFYFSFRSPYTWMAVNRLFAAVPDAHKVIDFIPYWDPDPDTERALGERAAAFHYAPMSKAKHLYILQDTKRLAGKLGLVMRWPVDIDPWWEVPHLAWLRARELGFGLPFFTAVLAARWEQGEKICEPGVIASIGTSIGADGEALAAAVTDPRIRAEAIDCLVRAFEDDVFGVPYFLAGPHRFWGFDRVDDFLAVLLPILERGELTAAAKGQASVPVPTAERLLAGDLTPPPGLTGTGYDTDTAGGCG